MVQVNLQKEIFKKVPGYDNYFVSNYGRVFSQYSNCYLTPHQNKRNKVWTLGLSQYGKVKTFSCARIVALTWIKNPNVKLYNYAIHKDGNLNDYTVDNVMWGTSSQSIQRKIVRHPELKEKFRPKPGATPPTQKMTNSLIEKLITFSKQGYSARQLAEIFPIGKSQICNIINDNKKLGNLKNKYSNA